MVIYTVNELFFLYHVYIDGLHVAVHYRRKLSCILGILTLI